MKHPIKIFMHLNDMPGAFDLMGEQLTRLSESGLLEAAETVLLCTNGDVYNFDPARATLQEFQNIKFWHASNRVDWYEWPTLDILKRNCDAVPNGEDFYVMYFHLKGLSRLGDTNVYDWRQYMEYWVIDRWEDNIAKLDEGYDTCGANYMDKHPWQHYSGNFWWSRASYIKKLPKIPHPDIIKTKFGTQSPWTEAIYDPGNFRYDYEAWIGTGNPKWANLHSSPGYDEPGWHFRNPYPESNYK